MRQLPSALLLAGLAHSQNQPQGTVVWPYPSAGLWSNDPTADPCSLTASEDSGRARMTVAECPSDCGDRSPYRCAGTDVLVPWWKVCDGLNDCPGSQTLVGTRCEIAMDGDTQSQQLRCADDELACDSMLDRAMDGMVAGLRYNSTSGRLSKQSLLATVPLGTVARIPVVDRLDHGTGWNYFRMAIEGRYGGGVSCDTVRDQPSAELPNCAAILRRCRSCD